MLVRLENAPVDKTLNDGHLSLLELLLRVTTSGVGEVDGMADLDVVGERDVLNLDTDEYDEQREKNGKKWLAHSWVSHFPNSLTSWPSFEMSLGRVVAAILRVLRTARACECDDGRLLFVLVVYTENQGLRRRTFPLNCTVTQ